MRTIARIDIKNQDVIKGINLEGLRKIGNPENIVKEYYLNGKLKVVGNYTGGQASGEWKYFDEKGTLTESKLHGKP